MTWPTQSGNTTANEFMARGNRSIVNINCYSKALLAPLALLLFVALSSIGQDGCSNQPLVNNTTCLACHDGRSAPDKTEFRISAHREIDCEGCHGSGYAHVRNGGRDGLFIENPAHAPFSRSYDLCQPCHEDSVNSYFQTAHSTKPGARCTDCHDVHKENGLVAGKALPALFDNDTAVDLCGRCHEEEVEGFLLSGHVAADAVACGNCHNMHLPDGMTQSVADNRICLQCHASFLLGFETDEATDFHTGTFHPVDPEGSGSSRCVPCHLPPLEQGGGDNAPHDHTLATVPPQFSNDAGDAGVIPVPPNSCAGIPGCHDVNFPGSGDPFDVNIPADNDFLQPLYESIGDIL